jgi:hypothetical protein
MDSLRKSIRKGPFNHVILEKVEYLKDDEHSDEDEGRNLLIFRNE